MSAAVEKVAPRESRRVAVASMTTGVTTATIDARDTARALMTTAGAEEIRTIAETGRGTMITGRTPAAAADLASMIAMAERGIVDLAWRMRRAKKMIGTGEGAVPMTMTKGRQEVGGKRGVATTTTRLSPIATARGLALTTMTTFSREGIGAGGLPPMTKRTVAGTAGPRTAGRLRWMTSSPQGLPSLPSGVAGGKKTRSVAGRRGTSRFVSQVKRGEATCMRTTGAIRSLREVDACLGPEDPMITPGISLLASRFWSKGTGFWPQNRTTCCDELSDILGGANPGKKAE
eukprot:scaffold2518_cov248-Pinguiococcus_pyrenoidosus.AAC.2